MGRILFVCSGNIIRSPFAERYAALLVQRRGGELAVESAGHQALDGHPMEAFMAAELQARGGTASGFRSRSLEAFMLDDADLVLTMTLRQRHLIRSGWPYCQDRVHTLGLAGRVAGQVGTVLGPGHLAAVLTERLDRLSTDDDIPDPYLRGPAVAAEVADLLAARVSALVDAVL